MTKYIGVLVWYQLCRDDILADDWEVEEKRVTITFDDLTKAMKRVCFLKEEHYHTGPDIDVRFLAKELGLIK